MIGHFSPRAARGECRGAIVNSASEDCDEDLGRLDALRPVLEQVESHGTGYPPIA